MRSLTFFWRSGKFSLLVQDQQFIPGKMKSTDIWCVISWLIFLQRLLLNEFLYYSAATRRLLRVFRSNYSFGMRLILNIVRDASKSASAAARDVFKDALQN
jgi:hypothetical protein